MQRELLIPWILIFETHDSSADFLAELVEASRSEPSSVEAPIPGGP